MMKMMLKRGNHLQSSVHVYCDRCYQKAQWRLVSKKSVIKIFHKLKFFEVFF